MAHVVVEPILRAAFGQGASVTDSRRDLTKEVNTILRRGLEFAKRKNTRSAR
jgi:hypothetical protein